MTQDAQHGLVAECPATDAEVDGLLGLLLRILGEQQQDVDELPRALGIVAILQFPAHELEGFAPWLSFECLGVVQAARLPLTRDVVRALTKGVMADMRLAVLSDIHGNRWALEAVLADIERRGIHKLVNLGDSLYGPLDPAGTAEALLPLNIPTVRGNEDRMIANPSDGEADLPTLCYVRDNLAAEHIQWLDMLPLTLSVHRHFRLFHGTQDRDDEYLLEEVTETGVRLRGPEELGARLASIEQPVILCGHSHVPRTIHLPDGGLIVNPGSVGLQAYTDNVPSPHYMEAGTPRARYAIVSHGDAGWHVEQVTVSYDWTTAANVAQENGRPDWAAWLRTGRARAPVRLLRVDPPHPFPR